MKTPTGPTSAISTTAKTLPVSKPAIVPVGPFVPYDLTAEIEKWADAVVKREYQKRDKRSRRMYESRN